MLHNLGCPVIPKGQSQEFFHLCACIFGSILNNMCAKILFTSWFEVYRPVESASNFLCGRFGVV